MLFEGLVIALLLALAIVLVIWCELRYPPPRRKR